MYNFDSDATSETKDFWGDNRGVPMQNPKSRGLLNGKTNILEYPCKAANRSVPYFEELDSNQFESTSQYLTQIINLLHDQAIDFADNNYPVKHLDQFPDGTITVKEASEKSLKYRLSVNDNRYWQYHRNNGVTKLGIIN